MKESAYMIILGKNELENKTISVRSRSGEKLEGIKVEELVEKLKDEIKEAFNK